ncbi:MAG TPA: SRPBCC family protein [Thermoleophilaceae bacterium]|nr:SRPBCC family protein [Thermoleophilaceae bacterium]
MRIARAEGEVVLTPEAALRLWTDPNRWSTFMEGFARIVERDPEWPAEGARLVWESAPAGRGKVTEKVVEPPASDRFASRVFEERLVGVQTFRAAESEGGSRVELSLEYTLTKYGPLGAVADVIFIRRALRDSLRRTLFRFEIEAEEEAGLR